MKLFEHITYTHKPQNVNTRHRAEVAASSLNTRIAVKLTQWVGSMPCAYFFTAIAIVGLFGLLGWLNPFIFLLMQWLSQQFLQLVLLSVIMVGQSVLGRKQELQSEEQFNTTMKIYHDIEQISKHMDKQDEELIQQSQAIRDIREKLLS
jgi:uncharacterized membrane protein